jgi:hypothetical protein
MMNLGHKLLEQEFSHNLTDRQNHNNILIRTSREENKASPLRNKEGTYLSFPPLCNNPLQSHNTFYTCYYLT